MDHFTDSQMEAQTEHMREISQNAGRQATTLEQIEREMAIANKKALITNGLASLIGALVGGAVCAYVLSLLKLG